MISMRFKSIFLIISISSLVSTATLYAQKPTDSLTQDLYSKGIKNLEIGEYYTAQNLFQEIVILDSTHQDATMELMRLQFAQKNFVAAEELATRLVQLYPEDEKNWIALVDIYKATENLDGLSTAFDRLIALKPEDSSFYYDKALTLTLKEDYKGSLALYDKIESKFGLEDRLFIAKTEIYTQQNDVKKAVSEAKAFINFKPGESTPYLFLANTYLNLKKPKEALKVLNEVEPKFPNEPYIPLTKADAFKRTNKSDQVFEELTKAFKMDSLPVEVKIRAIYSVFQDFDKKISFPFAEKLSSMLVESNPNQASAHAVYGDILLQKGQLEEARGYFLKALSLDKNLDFIWTQLLQLEVSEGKYADAQKHGLEAVNVFPNHSGILLFTGYAYLLDKKHKEARAFLEEALNQANPENTDLMVQIYSSLGDTYHAVNLHAESNVAYEEALKIDSNNTYVLNNFAYYLALRKEELSKAASMSKKSNELNPGNASFQDTYAWVLFQQENYDEALTWIEKAISAAEKPTATLIEHKGDILFKLGKKEEALSYWEKALQLTGTEKNEKLHQKIKEKIYVD